MMVVVGKEGRKGGTDGRMEGRKGRTSRKEARKQGRISRKGGRKVIKEEREEEGRKEGWTDGRNGLRKERAD